MTNLDGFLRVPHGVFKVDVRFALLTLLTEEFEANDAVVLMRPHLRWLDPERHSTFHRRPGVAA